MGQSPASMSQGLALPGRCAAPKCDYHQEHIIEPVAVATGPSVTRRADDLRALLRRLEHQLSARPAPDLAATGCAYRDLCDWTLERRADRDLGAVLDRLEPEGMYPEWRRHALEDAYAQYYEDVEREHPASLRQLPPPPDHKRQTRSSTMGSKRCFESGSRFWRSERFEYELQRPAPACSKCDQSACGAVDAATTASDLGCVVHTASTLSGGGTPPLAKVSAPRDIVSKGSSSRYCSCAVDPISMFMDSLSGPRPLSAELAPSMAGSSRRFPPQAERTPPGSRAAEAAPQASQV